MQDKKLLQKYLGSGSDGLMNQICARQREINLSDHHRHGVINSPVFMPAG
jgi:hypothetical protein